jgi:hypothetical protein
MTTPILGYLTSELDKLRVEEKQLHDLIIFVESNLAKLNKYKTQNSQNKGNLLLDILSDKIVDVNAIVIYLKYSIRKIIIKEANEKEKTEDNDDVDEQIKSIICKPLNFGMISDLEKEKYQSQSLNPGEEINKINQQLIEALVNENYEEFFKLKTIMFYLESLKN